MMEFAYLLVPGVVLTLFFFAGWRRSKGERAKLEDGARAFDSFVQTVKDDQVLLDDLAKQARRNKEKLDEYKRKADEYLAKIEEVITERETWRALYNDQAGGHDNAQALMLDAINKLLHVYRRDTGKSPQLDPMIELVRGEWVSVHGSEARENLGSDGKPKDSDRKPA